MDAAIFLRSKWLWGAWCAAPVVLLTVASAGGAALCARLRSDAEWRTSFFETMPELRATLDHARAMVTNSFHTARSPSEARERISGLLSRIAQSCAFTLQSIQIEESKADPRALVAVVRGDGRLSSILAFMQEAERPAHLVVLAKANLSAMQPVADPIYQVEMTFHYTYNPR